MTVPLERFGDPGMTDDDVEKIRIWLLTAPMDAEVRLGLDMLVRELRRAWARIRELEARIPGDELAREAFKVLDAKETP